MSGGVDSSATAALLQEQGYDVVGITLKLWPQDCVNRAEDKCCGPQAVTDARAVCHKLGIPYYLIDEAADFQKYVIQYFADARDRFTGAARPRRASDREIRVLAAQLEASLAADADFAAAIAGHRAMLADAAGSLARLEAGGQMVSPGRLKTISGMRQPGEVLRT